MSKFRHLDWSAALRDLKADRRALSPVREERLRSTAGLRGSPAIALSAWRGRSGKRYVVGVHALSASHFDEVGEAVVIAVRRDVHGIADIVDLATTEAVDEPEFWIDAARRFGATELHVHRLAKTGSECREIAVDLRERVEAVA